MGTISGWQGGAAIAIKGRLAKLEYDHVGTNMTEKGITLDFIGWADTFTFDPKVQDALNRAFVAGQDRLIATTLAPHVATVQALAVAEAARTRWNGAVPANLALSLMPQGIAEALAHFVGLPGAAKSAQPAAPQ